MTEIITYSSRGLRYPRSLSHSVFQLGSAMIGRWRQYRSLRSIESLPLDIQKDIGWPAADAKR